MRAVPAWVDKVHDRDKVEQCIYDLCFNPEGTRLIVAAGQRVLVYDTHDGSLIQPLKGHKDTVYCVCYAKDGKKFASGSADKSVIIWTSNLEGILKYSHNDALQCLAYNPVTHHLASCAISDFAFWSPEFKAVQKYKSNSRINTCAWTNDGQYLAIGLSNGTVSIRNKSGEEQGRIERTNSPQVPIWSIAWNPSTEEDILCIADWGQTISFYTIGGKMVGKERHVGFDPLCVSYISNGEYLLVSGTNRMCTLMTRDGIKLGTIGDQQPSWVWCCAARFDSSFVALGCQDGTIAFYQLLFNTVHGLYKEKYAFRENMTDVIIQHLLTDEKVRIKCRDLIKKIAIYENRLAVQLPERVVIYELYNNEQEEKGMHYRVKEKISRKLECNLLVVCTDHLVLCQERKLQSLSFDGALEREWFMDSAIRYIKVIGGTAGREGLLLGLKNGQVCKIFLDNPFPVNLLKIGSAIRCLDQNESMTKLAIVTENNHCLVYDSDNQELLFQEPNANSVAWNSDIDDMLCFSGNNILSIKLSNFPVHQQKLMGFVVGFSGSKVFCLHISTMSAIEVPLSAPMCQYTEKKMFQEAYTIASLGVTQADWETLAFKSLEGLNLEIALLAFSHIKDLRYVDLISDFQNNQHGEKDIEIFMGDVLAYQGRFREAAQVYKRYKQEENALNMYTDLRMFDLAQEFLGSVDNADQKALIRKKADWARDINEPKAAAWMYFSAGDIPKAIDIAGENGWVDMLMDMGARLDKADRPAMEQVAKHFRALGESGHAAEMYQKLGDDKSVVAVYVEAGQWSEAFALAEKNPDLRDLVYAPYALWLAEHNEFAEAQKAFHKAGRPEEAFRVLHQLTLNAVEESRLQDAGYYYWVLSRQCLEIANLNKERKEEMLEKFHQHEKLSSIYYAYDFIERYIDEPFLSCLPEGLFNIARYLIHETSGLQLQGISQFFIHYTLAKQGRNLGAFKTTHQVLKKIQSLCIPPEFEDNVGLGLMLNRTKAYNDNEELLPMCYRCSTYNPLWSKSGNSCSNCLHPFMYSFIYFEVLPLVEFKLEADVGVDEAVTLIQTPATQAKQDEGWSQSVSDNFQTLQLDDDNMDDPFTTKLMEFENVSDEYVPVTVDRATLKSMDPTSVIICRWPEPLTWQFYKNVLPDLPVTLCNSCFKIFYVDDFEKQVLQKEHCPFCRCQQTECQTSETVTTFSEFTAF